MAFTTPSASNQRAPVIYLLPKPSSTSNYSEFGVMQATAGCPSSVGFAEMSEGVQLSKPTGAWPRRISAFITSAASNQSAP